MPDGTLDPLRTILDGCRPAAVAVSGGVDSMTLAHVAHDVLGDDVAMFHAASPAVPADAAARIREHAERHGWRLHVVDAGEFDDERYLANPSNRCFFCKSDLYGTLAAHTGARLLSGTNVDDLGDWRPGLRAADDHAVRHPFVEAGMSKQDVRDAAARLGLHDLAELPSAPCLSSRVETGIRILPSSLRAIDAVESMLRETLRPSTVRCRMRADGVVVELDRGSLDLLDDPRRRELTDRVRDATGLTITGFTAYERGSAFLRVPADG
jgi:pyridinium-3,5-biscarboxylic acid mononucleotide sulfurtransferase